MQINWIHFASIVSEAKAFYNVSATQIDLLALIFLLVYIFVSIPASYIIDSWGMRTGVGIGVTLMGGFALLKGIYGSEYHMLLIAQTGIAAGQPFLNNAITKVGVLWFPLRERATAAGICMLSQIMGMLLALGVTPFLYKAYGMQNMLMTYGVLTAAGAVVYLIFARECPPTPPCPAGHDERIKVFAGLKHIFKQRDMIILLIAFFFGLGVFNAITTWIEQILSPRGYSIEQAGIAGSLLMFCGIVGAVLFGAVSDKLRKRRIFIIIAMGGAAPGLLGLIYAPSYPLLLVCCALLGFFMIGGSPICFQYGAEVSHPAPEATSQGLLMLVGQISAIIFIIVPDILLEGGDKTPALLLFVGFLFLTFFLDLFLQESKHILTGDI
ncbi:MAG: MFS transporter [Deltaproteobacteria bacterium]|nr:MFS transporter [Deltaproteobacteria bacterium]